MKFLFALLVLIPLSAHAESQSDSILLQDPLEYVLHIDEHSYSVYYQADADVLAMDVDRELRSLLIGLDNARESILTIELQREIIDAENGDFLILVDGLEADYNIQSDSDSNTFSIYVPVFTEEVEIVGTHVIPEFPFGVILTFILMVAFMTAATRVKSIKW